MLEATIAYDKGTPIMTDRKYDEMVKEYNKLRGNDGDIITAPHVGAALTGADVQHTRPMQSLDNVFLGEGEPFTPVEKMRKQIHAPLFHLCLESKYDGAAIRNLYVFDGDAAWRLTQAATRGDGKTGTDITEHAKCIQGIPASLHQQALEHVAWKPSAGDMLHVTGEAVQSYANFEAVNRALVEQGGEALKHPRSVVAGAINGKRPQACAEKRVEFIAYDAHFEPSKTYGTQRETLKALSLAGFRVAKTLQTFAITSEDDYALAKDIRQACEEALDANDTEFPTDGVVLKIDERAYQSEIGSHSTAPRWAFAVKRRGAASAEATLLNIDWQEGRTGRLTPVGTITPTILDGVEVTRVTLHNWRFINDKGLGRIPIRVRVERAGGVIPAIMGAVAEAEPDAIQTTPPEVCPSCGARVVMSDSEAQTVFCPATNCTARVKRRLLHAAGREYLDWDGIGPEQVSALVESGLVSGIADMYKVTREQALALDGFGLGKADNLVDVVANSAALPLNRKIAALGIHGVGNRAALKVVNKFPTLKDLLAAEQADIAKIPSFGEKRAHALHEALNGDEGRQLTKMVEYAPSPEAATPSAVTPDDAAQDATVQDAAVQDAAVQPLAGMAVCATGKFTQMSRREVNAFIISLGGEAQSSITKATNLLVTGERVGATKMNKAAKLGVETISEAEFMTRYGA